MERNNNVAISIDFDGITKWSLDNESGEEKKDMSADL